MASIEIYTPNEYAREELYPAAFQEVLQDLEQRAYSKVLHTLAMNPSVAPNKVLELSKTYGLLLEYYQKGASDPQREEILARLDEELMEIFHRLVFQYDLSQHPSSLKARTRARIKEEQVDLFPHALITELLRAEPELAKEEQILQNRARTSKYFAQVEQLFQLLWITPLLSISEVEVLQRILERSSAPFATRALTGALYLATLQHFDPHKLQLLGHIYAHNPSDEVRAAALASLLILGRRHERELTRWYPKLTAEIHQLLAIGGEKGHEGEVAQAVETIHICYQTARRTKYFDEYIKPKMTNLSEQVRSFLGTDPMNEMPSLEEMEPGAMDELAKIAREGETLSSNFMQDKELDLTYPLMVELKAFPFFHTLSHWFLPYTKSHPALDWENAVALETVAPYVFQEQEIISNDRYSFASMNTWKMVEKQLMQQIQDGAPLLIPHPEQHTFRGYLRDYLFGLYRFHHLSPQHKEFPNPFLKDPFVLDGAFTQSPLGAVHSGSLLQEEELWTLYRQLNRYKDYQGASGMCRRLIIDYKEASAEVLRGLAVAALLKNNLQAALELLQAAIQKEGKQATTVRYVAEILYKQGDPIRAIRWLQSSEEVEDPKGDLALILTKLLQEVGLFEEALQAAFKAKFLTDGKNPTALHLLALLLIRNNRPEEALEQASSGAEEPQLHCAQGIAHLALRQVEQGLALLQEWIVAGRPGNFDLRECLNALEGVGYEIWERRLVEDVLRNEQHLREEKSEE